MKVVARVLLCVALAGCADRTPSAALSPLARALEGRWVVTFTPESALVLAHLRSGIPPLSGTMVFVPNRWLHDHAWEFGVPSNYGVYDIDFREFGFDPRDPDEPAMVYAGPIVGDSIGITLHDSRDQTIVALRGSLAGDSVTGTWTGGNVRASAWGAFRMTRR